MKEFESSSSPIVSIVTPSFNHADYIEKTVLSVLKQDYENIEYIVVDGLSQDGTEKILAKYKKRISRIICEPDGGQSDAIDKGFRLTSGQIMAYINSDDCYASPQVVSRVVDLFDKNPEVDVIYGRRQFVDQRGHLVLNQPHRVFDAEALKRACYLPQECVFWRREIYSKCGFYIDKSFDFAMDYDLWLRFLDAGARFLAVNEVFGLFRWYAEQKSQEFWNTHGLPEIAKLQERSLGRSLTEPEMTLAHDTFLFGASRRSDQATWLSVQPIWLDFLNTKRDWLNSCPLDTWVFQGSYVQQNQSR